jgi:hypothetical protein
MKPRKQFTLIPLIIILIACSNNHSNVPTILSSTASPEVISTEIETATSTAVSFKQTPDATLTPFVTLEPEQAKGKLLQLLKDQEACSLSHPCFWGITPGETTLSEAEGIFANLGIFIEAFNEDGKIIYAKGLDVGNGLHLHVRLRTKDNEIVESLQTDVFVLDSKKDALTQQEWSAFSPPKILATYGKPSRVDFYLSHDLQDGFPPNTYIPTFYHFVMHFEESGLVIEYGRNVFTDENTFTACPLIDKSKGVRVFLGENFDTRRSPPPGIPVEQATSLSLDQFYNLMLQNPEKACFNLSKDVFKY